MRASLVACLLLGACHHPLVYSVATGARDWAAHPAIAQRPTGTVYAVSDVHGGYDRLVTLLARYGLIDGEPASPATVQWLGGDATLIVVGDLFDKGPAGVDVLDLMRALQSQSADHVIVTLGNHEAEFFADPSNSKAEASDGIDPELAERGIDLVAIASGADPRGAWLRQQPFAARAGGWFFAHAGNTKGRTIDALDADLRTAFDTHDFQDDEFVGGDSLLEARDWFDSAPANLAALGVQHVVFGHDPGALGAHGSIATAQSGALLRIDCGMSPDVGYSDGALLRIRADGTDEVAEQLGPVGNVTELWRGRAL